MLTSLNQKVRGTDSALRFRTAQPMIPPVHRRTLSRHSQIMRNMVSPYSSFSERQGAARRTEGNAGKGCRRKRKPHCNDADSGSEFAAARKGADFRQVADHGKDYEKFCRSQHGQTPGIRADR